MDKKKYVRVDPFTGFPEKDVKEDAPTTSTAGVAATGDDPTVVVRKKKKLYDGRTRIAKKFVERILKQRESRKLNKEEVELDEVLKPKDKKVIDDFVQMNKGTGAQNFTQRGSIVDYEGRSLEKKGGMGAQQIASLESDPKENNITKPENNSNNNNRQRNVRRNVFSLINGVTRSKKSRSNRAKSVTIQAILYVMAFLLSWIFVCVNMIIENKRGTSGVPYVLRLMGKISNPLQGFNTMLVYTRPHVISCRRKHKEYSWLRAFFSVITSGGDNDSKLKDRRLERMSLKSPSELRINGSYPDTCHRISVLVQANGPD